MQDLNDLYYFVVIVDNGGFAGAERATGIPKSRLSRRLAKLEESLGVQLLVRSTRHISTTDIGKSYYQHCVAMIQEAKSAADLIDKNKSEPAGTLRLSCPPQLLNYVVSKMLVEFLVLYPKVNLEVNAIGRRVDPEIEGLDMAIRVRFPPEDTSRLPVYKLSESPQKLLVSPDLLDKLAPIVQPDDLAGSPTLDWERKGDSWIFTHKDGTTASVKTSPRVITDDLSILRMSAVKGLGVVQLPLMLVIDDIKSGSLVELLPDWSLSTGIVQAVLPSSRILMPNVKHLLKHLQLSFGKYDFYSV